jgi:hypothetical protein
MNIIDVSKKLFSARLMVLSVLPDSPNWALETLGSTNANLRRWYRPQLAFCHALPIMRRHIMAGPVFAP